MTRTASEVVLSEEELTARPYIGRPTTLRWEEIGEVEEHRSLGAGRQVRLIARDGRRIVIDPRLPRFQELLNTVREKATNARRTRRAGGTGQFTLPSWWFALAAAGVVATVGVGLFMLAQGKTVVGVICLVLAPLGLGELVYIRHGSRIETAPRRTVSCPSRLLVLASPSSSHGRQARASR